MLQWHHTCVQLPCPVVTEEYVKEYGADSFQLPVRVYALCRAQMRAVGLDHGRADGGHCRRSAGHGRHHDRRRQSGPCVRRTSLAHAAQVRKLGGTVAECLCLIGLPELNGAAKVGAPCFTLLNLPAGC